MECMENLSSVRFFDSEQQSIRDAQKQALIAIRSKEKWIKYVSFRQYKRIKITSLMIDYSSLSDVRRAAFRALLVQCIVCSTPHC